MVCLGIFVVVWCYLANLSRFCWEIVIIPYPPSPSHCGRDLKTWWNTFNDFQSWRRGQRIKVFGIFSLNFSKNFVWISTYIRLKAKHYSKELKKKMSFYLFIDFFGHNSLCVRNDNKNVKNFKLRNRNQIYSSKGKK